MPEQNVLVVLSNPTEGNEEEFDDWYEHTHLPQVCDVPGVVGAERYRVAQIDGPAPSHQFLAIYRLEQDPATVLDEIKARVASGVIEMNDTIDLTSVSMTAWSATAREGRA